MCCIEGCIWHVLTRYLCRFACFRDFPKPVIKLEYGFVILREVLFYSRKLTLFPENICWVCWWMGCLILVKYVFLGEHSSLPDPFHNWIFLGIHFPSGSRFDQMNESVSSCLSGSWEVKRAPNRVMPTFSPLSAPDLNFLYTPSVWVWTGIQSFRHQKRQRQYRYTLS